MASLHSGKLSSLPLAIPAPDPTLFPPETRKTRPAERCAPNSFLDTGLNRFQKSYRSHLVESIPGATQVQNKTIWDSVSDPSPVQEPSFSYSSHSSPPDSFARRSISSTTGPSTPACVSLSPELSFSTSLLPPLGSNVADPFNPSFAQSQLQLSAQPHTHVHPPVVNKDEDMTFTDSTRFNSGSESMSGNYGPAKSDGSVPINSILSGNTSLMSGGYGPSYPQSSRQYSDISSHQQQQQQQQTAYGSVSSAGYQSLPSASVASSSADVHSRQRSEQPSVPFSHQYSQLPHGNILPPDFPPVRYDVGSQQPGALNPAVAISNTGRLQSAAPQTRLVSNFAGPYGNTLSSGLVNSSFYPPSVPVDHDHPVYNRVGHSTSSAGMSVQQVGNYPSSDGRLPDMHMGVPQQAHSHTHQHHYMHPHSHPHSVPLMSSDVNSSGVRVLGARPKPQCWEHGCNGREFSTFSNLLRHQREKSGMAAKSNCPRCGAEFTRTTARNGHMAHDKCRKRTQSKQYPPSPDGSATSAA